LNNNSDKAERNFIFPKTFFFEGGYISFDDIATKDIEIENALIKLDDIGEIVAKVHSPFIHRLISNFARYYNRFGTPNIEI